MFSKNKGQGNSSISFLDLSYINPYDILIRPFRTFWIGVRDPNSGIGETMLTTATEAFDPVAKEQIFFGSMVDALRGVTAQGSRVWDRTDSIEERGAKGIWHIIRTALTPGTVDSVIRVDRGRRQFVTPSGRRYQFWEELISNTFGVRMNSVDMENTMQWAARQLKFDINESSSKFNRVFGSAGTQTDRAIINGYNEANEGLKAAYQLYREKHVAAIRLGTMTQEELIESMEAEGVSKKAIEAIIYNEMPPYEPTPRTLKKGEEMGARPELDHDRLSVYDTVRELQPPVIEISKDDF